VRIDRELTAVDVDLGGNDVTKIVHCIDGHLSVSANSNTVTVTVTVDGHCASVTVSGNANAVVVDSADSITLAGIDGTVTSHSGSPKITNHGISNTATQG
jgi:carbon monoxide dehydrogenase subunit G